jgi:hypothetical protein
VTVPLAPLQKEIETALKWTEGRRCDESCFGRLSGSFKIACLRTKFSIPFIGILPFILADSHEHDFRESEPLPLVAQHDYGDCSFLSAIADCTSRTHKGQIAPLFSTSNTASGAVGIPHNKQDTGKASMDGVSCSFIFATG